MLDVAPTPPTRTMSRIKNAAMARGWTDITTWTPADSDRQHMKFASGSHRIYVEFSRGRAIYSATAYALDPLRPGVPRWDTQLTLVKNKGNQPVDQVLEWFALYGPELPERCDPATGTHSNPHIDCMLR